MVPRTSYPPVVHHPTLTKTLTPTVAQTQLASFLEKTSTQPHLHPDSLLSTTGITYSAHSGPAGGLALHHLRRIEAGLRGENLIAETEEDLKAQFDENGELEGDDVALDEGIERTERKMRKESKKRKRVEEIQDWAEDTSSQADHSVTVPGREIESFAHTPLHQSDYPETEGAGEEWQEQEEWELQQRPLEGEVGEREGAPVAGQNRGVPKLVEHGDGGKRELTKAEKKARKDAKKARRKDLREQGRTED